MRFGAACSRDWLPTLKSWGYDYWETQFSTLVTMEDADFEALQRDLDAAGLQAESFNQFFSGDIVLYGENKTSLEDIRAYAERGFARAKALGGKIAVLGSGRVRNIPEGANPATCLQEFVSALKVCGDVAAKYGMKIAIEPLNAKETNFIQTVHDGMEVVNLANHPAVGVLVDFYHATMSGEPLEYLNETNGKLYHAHFARPSADRGCRPAEEDMEIVRTWAAKLHEIGYNDRLSLEGRFTPPFEEMMKYTREKLNVFDVK